MYLDSSPQSGVDLSLEKSIRLYPCAISTCASGKDRGREAFFSLASSHFSPSCKSWLCYKIVTSFTIMVLLLLELYDYTTIDVHVRRIVYSLSYLNIFACLFSLLFMCIGYMILVCLYSRKDC